jgi:taurine dioxygenase
VVFRNQHLDRHTFAEVARRIGRPEAHPFISEDDPVVHGISPFQPYHEYPEITGIYHDAEHTGNLNVWHSDLYWREVPPAGLILRAVQVPPQGGDTCWADMGAAYRSLSDQTRSELAEMRVVHDWLRIYSSAFADDEVLMDRMRAKFPPPTHPLVLTHPKTGEEVLFSNKSSATRIEGLAEEESRRILDMVHLLAWRPEFQCRLRWEEGDVTIWDNLASQHYAVSDYWPHVRKMERILLEGEPIK